MLFNLLFPKVERNFKLLRTPVSEEQARAGRRGSADLHHIYVA